MRIGAREEARVPVMAGAAVGGGVSATSEIPIPPAPTAASDLPDTAPLPTKEDPPDDPNRTFVWLIPALVGTAALVVLALFGFGILDDSSAPVAQGTTVPTAPPTTAAAAPITVAPAPTTVAPAPTTTSTTTTTIPDASSLAAVGDPVAVPSLKLRAGGIGPIDFGTPADEAIGRLVASLGQPDETGAAGEELGLCADEEGRFARWAGFTAVVSGLFDGGTFAGYRFDEQAVPTFHLDLATPSGVRLGDTVSFLNKTYASYQIDYVTAGGTDVFHLSDADGLLLWGPVSSTEDSGRIEGIYSPDSCSS
ncbi:MAG: hypothetical protein ABFR89_07895 [Actinomycetota bacterium]